MRKDKSLWIIIRIRFFKYIVPCLYLTAFFLSLLIFRNKLSSSSSETKDDKVVYEDPYSKTATSNVKSYQPFPYVARQCVLPIAPYKHLQDTTDIRSTYVIYLESISNYLNQVKSSKNVKLTPPVLSFHWVDWTELNILNPLLEEKEKPNCFRIGALGATKRTPWPGCSEDTDKNGDANEKLGFKFVSPATDFESEFRLSLRAKAYLYTSAPIPKRAIFLGGELAFVVKIGTKSRLSKNGMIDKYLTRKSEMKHVPIPDLIALPVAPQDELRLISQYLDRPLTSVDGERYAFIDLEDEVFNYPSDNQRSKIAIDARESNDKHFHDVLFQGNNGENQILPYDWRFFNKHLNRFQHRAALHYTIRAWLQMTSNLGLTAWLSQESLIGWSRNGLILPWENVIHFEMPAKDIGRLATSFNESLVIADPEDGTGNYYLDVSPHYLERARHNDGGASPESPDARFIDTRTGVYIEITGVMASDTDLPESVSKEFSAEIATSSNKVKFFNSGRGNFYYVDELLPLKKTIFEGRMANVPRMATKITIREYPDVSESMHFYNYAYQDHLRLWVPESKCRYVPHEDIEIFDKGGSTYIGACHDNNIWTEYNLTSKATLFKRMENTTTSISFGAQDELGSLYPDFWLQDRIRNLKRKFGYKSERN